MAVILFSTNNNNNSAAKSCATALLKFFSILCILNGSFAFSSINFANMSKYLRYDVNDDPAVNVYGENTRPIIGILSQEPLKFALENYPNEHFASYIAASYVKFVEGAGGRAVPIRIGQNKEYYVDLMSKINGVIFPGGATYFNQSNGYADAGRYIYDIASEMNDRGIHIPIWGTCLGFELLVYLSSNSTDFRIRCESMAQALPLEFENGYRDSRLFKPASDEILQFLSKFNVTANFHRYCFTKQQLAERGLNKMWKVLSINHDWYGFEFISTIEHAKYPFYGVQYHPEKPLYEFIPNRNITHTTNAILVSQYFANFFMNEARKNQQKFNNLTEETNALFYNYNPVYSGAKGSGFEQVYLFKAENSAAGMRMGTKLNLLFALITLFALVS